MNNKDFAAMNESFRSAADYRLIESMPIIMMLDGRAFSKYCKRFEKPFDNTFIELMNETAAYLCASIQNAKFAFVQSDEISIYIQKCEGDTGSWFNSRISKMCSVAASMAASFFIVNLMKKTMSAVNDIDNIGLPSFDCKVWNVENEHDVSDWFVYRQTDCIRNSKSMFAQTYASHSVLLNKHTDEMVEYVRETYNKNWNDSPDYCKYGRIVQKYNINIGTVENPVIRTQYKATPAPESVKEFTKKYFNL